MNRTIAGLAFEPRPANASELEDELTGFYRIRLDDYRIIYSIDDKVVTVEIARVGGVTWRWAWSTPQPWIERVAQRVEGQHPGLVYPLRRG